MKTVTEGDTTDDDGLNKVPVLNTIFEGLISDASDLVKDLSWGVKTYLFFGLIEILFGIQELAYNIEVLPERLYIPGIIAGVMIFAGVVQILNFVRLRQKYARLFQVQNDLTKS